MKFFTLLLCLNINITTAAISLDGKLDEPIWSSAQHFTNMVVVEPYTLATPKYQTEINVTANKQGIYFGIINWQDQQSRNNDTSARDQRIGSDKIQIIIDFDGNGITAYSFEIGSGGSIRDGIFSNENSFSNEWDGNWQAQTSATNDGWQVEVLIPWDVVSMKKSKSTDRQVKWYFARTVADNNQVYANVASNTDRQRFISDFSQLTIKDFAASSLQLYTATTARRDFHNGSSSGDIGIDVFWKSGAGKQLTATVNPDFGQIESDRLVVNFSATETFFNERRPFFTENQSLFDISGANGLRVLHTRRIGARPDKGTAAISDIDVALKYTDTHDLYTYGILAAFEAGGNGFAGRNFFAGRYLHRTATQTLGLTATFVDRVDIDRTALSYVLDHEYLWGEKFKLKSQFIGVDNKQTDTTDENGWGAWSQFQHQISNNQNYSIELSHYGRDFEINDFGFLPRNNLNTALYQHSIRQTDFSPDSALQQRQYDFGITFRSNDTGDTLGSTYQFNDEWQFKNSSTFSWHLNWFGSGVDDLISRNNGLVTTESGHNIGISYRSSNAEKLRYHGFFNLIDSFAEGKSIATHLHPSYFFQDNYSASLSIFYTDSNDWLNWIEDDLFGRYERKLLNTTLDINANFSQKQELRFRFQWLAIDANANKQYQLNSSGQLINTGNTINDFGVSNTALQIRYRYEFAPLSNLFVVYTRGGSFFEENNAGLFNLFSPGFSNVRSDNFLIKLRYKFF